VVSFLHIWQGLWVVKSNGLVPPGPPGNRGRSSPIPARPSAPGAEGLGTARCPMPLELKKRPTRRVWALVQLHPPNPPPRPASGSHRVPNPLGQVGEQYGPSIAPFARARCPFSPLLRPCSPGGAARVSYTGQFSCFGPRSCFIAPVLDIPNGVWSLNGAVGRAYIRETVPAFAPSSFDPSSFFQLRNPNPNKQETRSSPARPELGGHRTWRRRRPARFGYSALY
jgi:hypothetical protein